MSLGSWLHGVLLGLDRLGNAVAGGSSQETISSVQGRNQTWLGSLLDLIDSNHSIDAIEFTPWGTVDPHRLPPVQLQLAEDWDSFLEVLAGGDMDAFPFSTLEAAERAAQRLRAWERSGGRKRWTLRIIRDIAVGESISHVS